jgi:cell division protein FtsB
MTFIKPHSKKSILTLILAGMVCLLILGAGGLVFAYNRLVNIERSTALTTAALHKQEAENAKMKSELLSLFDGAHLAKFAESRSLVREKAPAYLKVESRWHFASGR